MISTCLQEIDNSRPFFIGLVGDRYGWIPSVSELLVNPELSERFPVVDDYFRQGLSITEIEMRYGALEAESKNNSFFLIKENVRHENERHACLVEELTSDHVNHAFYDSIEALVDKTRSAMMDLLDRTFPVVSDIPEWKRFESINANLAHGYVVGYVPHGDYLDRLNLWLDSDSQCLVVTGDSGSGKSSLIAEWLSRGSFGGYKVMSHFIGSRLSEGSYVGVQRHFLTRLEHEYGLAHTLVKANPQEEDYVVELENALAEAERRGDRWLLVVDGIDHLQNDAMAKIMMWFPELPPSAKALFSTVPSDMSYQRLCHALGYEELTLPPLERESVIAIAGSYLGNVGKSLDDDLFGLMAANPLFSNPYMLRMLLDELVTYGVHERIRAHVTDYASSNDKVDFFCKIINHAEEYYGRESIMDFISLIGLTKDGLAEDTLMDIMGLDAVEWSMLYCGMQNLMVYVDGKYCIADSDILHALDTHYGYDGQNEHCLNDFRGRIIACLEKDGADVIELAFQYYSAGWWERLYGVLMSPENVIGLILNNDRLFAMYWSALMEETDHDMSDYLDVEFRDLPYYDAYEQLFFLADAIRNQFSDPMLAVRLTEKANHIMISKEKDGGPSVAWEVASNYDTIAQAYMDMGEYDKAKVCLGLAEEAYAEGKEGFSSHHLLIQGNLHNCFGEYNEALALFIRAIEMEKEEDEDVPWKYLNNAGLAYFYLGQLDDAVEMLSEALDVIKRHLIVQTVEGAMVMNNLGLTYLELGDFDKAEDLFTKALETYRLNIVTPGTQVALTCNNLGLIYRDREDPDLEKAVESFMQAWEIQNDVAEKSLTTGLIALNLGVAYMMAEEFTRAEEWLVKSFEVYDGVADYSNPDFRNCCIALIDAYECTDQYEKALGLLESMIAGVSGQFGELDPLYADLHLRKAVLLRCYFDVSGDIVSYEFGIARNIYEMLGDQDGIESVDEAMREML